MPSQVRSMRRWWALKGEFLHAICLATGTRLPSRVGARTSPKDNATPDSGIIGAVAQLGERFHGMEEVVGSNPIGSILVLPVARTITHHSESEVS